MQDLSEFSVLEGFRDGSAIEAQLWWAVQATIFAWSPQILYRWWVFLLCLFDAKIRENVVIRPSVEIIYPQKLTLGDYVWVGNDVNSYALGKITIGTRPVISQKNYLCIGNHDHTGQHFTINVTPTAIGEKCWLAMGVFVAPGVTIGDGAAVGVRSSVFRSLPANVVRRGSPTVAIREHVETE